MTSSRRCWPVSPCCRSGRPTPPVIRRAEQLSQIVFQIAALTASDLFVAEQADPVGAAAIGAHAAAVEDRRALSAVTLMRLAHKLELQT